MIDNENPCLVDVPTKLAKILLKIEQEIDTLIEKFLNHQTSIGVINCKY
jgi:hypothetical protein